MDGANNKAPAKTSALVTRSDCLRLRAIGCVMICPNAMRITLMLCTTNATGAHRFHCAAKQSSMLSTKGAAHVFAMELLPAHPGWWGRVRFAERDFSTPVICALARGRTIVRVLPDERVLPSEPAGTPLPDAKSELPPVIRGAEVVAFALVALLVISVVAVLYVAKAFFLPVVTAFVVGTMLSPAAGFLERHRIPRSVSAILIVSAVGAAATFIVGLISSPLMEWS